MSQLSKLSIGVLAIFVITVYFLIILTPFVVVIVLICIPIFWFWNKLSSEKRVANTNEVLSKYQKTKNKETETLITNFVSKYRKELANILIINEFNIDKTHQYLLKKNQYLESSPIDIFQSDLEESVKVLSSKNSPLTEKEFLTIALSVALKKAKSNFEERIMIAKPKNCSEYVGAYSEGFERDYELYLKMFKELLLEKQIEFDERNLLNQIKTLINNRDIKRAEAKLNNQLVTIQDLINSGENLTKKILTSLFTSQGYTVTSVKLLKNNIIEFTTKKYGEKSSIYFSKAQEKMSLGEMKALISIIQPINTTIISTNYFTRPAKELSKQNEIILIDQDNLEELLEEQIITK
jgi:HJR/Mrr/RecB family endonuclease